MGCAGSKLDDLPAVALCRDRTQLLADAVHHRYALADAHAAYSRSLLAVGASLHRLLAGADATPGSPVLPLPLPPQRKGDSMPPLSPLSPAGDSHIEFQSSDSDSDSDSALHSGESSPIHHHHDLGSESDWPAAATVANLSYASSRPATATVHFSEYPYPGQNHSFDHYSSYSYEYPPNYSSYGGFFGSPSPPTAAASSSKTTPPPPSPPRYSPWEFLISFDSFYKYYPHYSSSRSSKDVREEEGEVVKEAYGDQKPAASTSAHSKHAEKEENRGRRDDPPEKLSDSDDGGESVKEVSVVEKNVVADKVMRPNVVSFAAPKKYHGISDVAGEIKAQFERASGAIDELSKRLEVGKLPYHRKESAYRVSARMMSVTGLSTSQSEDFLLFEEDKVGSRNLSSTLLKLYIWEKRLYEEVKNEEKMRTIHDRKYKRLKCLGERGAEAHNVHAIQSEITKLSTKIRIAIQVIESISKKINKLRDEELWPQINDLVQSFMRMWKVLLECHRTHCHAISVGKNIESVASGAPMELLLQLELELLDWIGNFSAWVIAQKNYVKALNGWLFLCLHYEPEETPDGIVPFSPGRLGAPPVFVICNYWLQAMERISEREVVDAMKAFASSVRYFWEQQNHKQQQRLMGNNNMDKQLRTQEREAQTINKAVDARNKKLVLVAGYDGAVQYGYVVNHTPNIEISSMQIGLRQVFEAMEKFTASSMKAYEELHAHAEEERVAREIAKVP